MFVFGILVGVVVALFTMFCLDAARDAKISDSELEAWEENLKRRKDGCSL